MVSKRSSFVRKLDLPPKFTSAMSGSLSEPEPLPAPPSIPPINDYSGPVPDPSNLPPQFQQPLLGNLNSSISPVPIQSQSLQFPGHETQAAVSSQTQPPAVSLPIASFHLNPLPTISTFALSGKTSSMHNPVPSVPGSLALVTKGLRLPISSLTFTEASGQKWFL